MLRSDFSPSAQPWVREIVLQRVRDSCDLDLRPALANLAASNERPFVRALARTLRLELERVERAAGDAVQLAELLESANAHERMIGARALGVDARRSSLGSQSSTQQPASVDAPPVAQLGPDSSAHHGEILGNLLWDSDPGVLRAATCTAGRFDAERFGQRICNMLVDPHLAEAAVRTLSQFGPAVDLALERSFSRPGQREEIQLRIMLIYGAREDPAAQRWIRRQVLHPRARVQHGALLNLAKRGVSLKGSEEESRLNAEIERLAGNVGWLGAALSGLRKESADTDPLRQALVGDLLAKRAEMFARLAVLYPGEAVNSARTNLDMGEKVHVDHAIEVLRSMVVPQLHEFVLPVAQGLDDVHAMTSLRQLVVESAASPEDWARAIVLRDSRRVGLWVKACALKFLRGHAGAESVAMLYHPSHLLREQAARALLESDRQRYEHCISRMGREGEVVDAMLFADTKRRELRPEEHSYFGLVRGLESSVLGRLSSHEGRLRLIESAERLSLPAGSLLGMRGESDTSVYLVLRGALRNRPRHADGVDEEYLVGPGALTTFGLGTRLLISEEPVELMATCGYRISEILWGERLLNHGS
ncbi:MAG: hypothetical protein KC457_04630 [Myxococcales bacterium]|nr:hypothetical protein [Myxococcales bacterium]